MTPTDRRSALHLLALAALAPMGALGIGTNRARAAAPLAVPPGPMVLRRTIERALGETAILTVTRAWACSFTRASEGIRVQGRQIAVAVEAPPSLAALAEIERKREVAELFPAELDASGRFLKSGYSDSPAKMERAIDVAFAMVRDSALESGAKIDARQFLARLGTTAAELISTVQPDLFYPVEGAHSLVRELPLAEGISGRLEVEWSASAHSSGVLAFAEKRIVTHVAGSARLARERWELAPI